MILAGFISYLIIVLAIGIYAWRRNRTQEDFLLAGRSLGPWMAALSERASGESAWLLLGLPAAAFTVALAETWTAVGVVTGIIVSWTLLSRRLRVETARCNTLTLTDFLACRFGDPHGVIRILASVIIIFFYTVYVAAQFNGAGKTLQITFNLPEMQGMVIAAVVIVLYTLAGGFLAVVWTDFFQALLMVATLVILPVSGLLMLDGWEPIAKNMALLGSKGQLFAGKTGLDAFLTAAAGLSWGFGYLAMPHLLTRYMALKSPDDARKGRIIAISWAIPAFTGAMLIGFVGLARYGVNNPLFSEAFGDPDRLMPTMAMDLLPAWLAGILICGAIAAMMSTADSQLMVITASVCEDLYHKAWGKNPDERTLVRISRSIVAGVGIVGFWLAVTTQDLIMTMVSYAWGGLANCFGPLILLTLYWRGLTRAGVITGLSAGFIGTILWKNTPLLQDFLPERLAVFVLNFLLVVVVSRMTAETAPENGQVSQ